MLRATELTVRGMNLRCWRAKAVKSRALPHPFRSTIDRHDSGHMSPPLFPWAEINEQCRFSHGPRYSHPLMSDGTSTSATTALPGRSFLSGLTPLSLLEHGANVTNIAAIPEAEGMCIRCVRRRVLTDVRLLTPFHRNHFATQFYMDHPPLRSRIHALHTLFPYRTSVYSYLLL